MRHSKHPGHSQDQEMMTLCAIAYDPITSLSMLQKKLDEAEALEGRYTVLWWAANDNTMLFLVRNRVNNTYAVAIRGEILRFGLPMLLQLYERFNMDNQVSMPYSRLGKAKIAAGVVEAIQEIYELTYEGVTISRVLNDLPKGARVFLTGHSLGGSIAGALAARIACTNLVNLDIIPWCFGAPAVGNDAYADLFDPGKSNYLFTQSLRCVNTLDTLSFVWNHVTGIYTIDYGTIKCPVEFTLCLECVDRLLILARVFYVQPPLQRHLRGGIHPDLPFFQQAMHQHSQNTYLGLLGLAPIDGVEFSYAETNRFVLADYL